MSKTIAITGATGFVGRHTVTELLRHGHRLVALVRNPAVAGLPADVKIVPGDLADVQAMARLVRGADTVVHVAGAIAAARAADYFRHNAEASRALADAALRAGVGQFVFASSLAARHHELSPYGASKLAAEQALSALGGRISLTMLRAPAVYGPGDRGTLPLIRELTHGIAVIPARRNARFSLMYVGDLARVLAATVADPAGGLVELSDGRAGGYCWDDLLAIAERIEGREIRPLFLPRAVAAVAAAAAGGVARITGRPGMVNPGKVNELYHDDWVARGEGWPLPGMVTFEQGLPLTLAWYRAEGWLPPPRRPDTRQPTRNQETSR